MLTWQCSEGSPICVENTKGKLPLTVNGGTALGSGWDYEGAAVVYTGELFLLTKATNTCFACGCFRGNGCFTPDTQITMADGTAKRAEDISAGEEVWNPVTGHAVKILRVLQGGEKKPLVSFGYGSGELTVSSEHPVRTLSGLKKAADLTLDDSVYDGNGEIRAISQISLVEPEEGQQVVNFLLDAEAGSDEGHYLLSDGIVTGDIALQLKLSEAAEKSK